MLVKDENYEQCRLVIKVILNTPIMVYTPLGYKEFVDLRDAFDLEKELFSYIERSLKIGDPILDSEITEMLIDELDLILQNHRIFTTYEDREELLEQDPTFEYYVEKLSWLARELRLE